MRSESEADPDGRPSAAESPGPVIDLAPVGEDDGRYGPPAAYGPDLGTPPDIGARPRYRPPKPAPPRYGLAFLLFTLTLFTTTTLGSVLYVSTRTDLVTSFWPVLLPEVVAGVWGDPVLLRLGLSFAVPSLFILLCHELGHYLACRYYQLPATLPYFLPVPLALGTVGAFIRIRAPLRTKKELFDVGIAGPIAGFVALLPFLLYGVAHSEPTPVLPAAPEAAISSLLVPGKSLAVTLATLAFHGPLPDGYVLNLHPFALAAWFGLFATALNLIPLGQLDGGHILYAAVGRHQRRLALPLWLALGLLGYFWPGWLLWCGIVLFLGLRHPPVRNEAEPLGPVRRVLAGVALLLLILSFMPVPLADLLVGL